MDKLRAVQTFVAIAENGSLTEAALRLDRSLPTVVRVLADLEKHLGVRLFNRSTRRVDLTEEGATYLHFCRRMIRDLERVEAELGEAPQNPKGLVTVTAPLYFGELHVAPAIASLLDEYPGLEVRLQLNDRVVNLLGEHLDVAVRIGHLRDSELRARSIGTVDQVLCASPAFLAQNGEVAEPQELSRCPCIRNDGNNAGITWPFQSPDGTAIHVSVSGPFTSNTVRPAVEACVGGLGYGLFLSYQVAEHVRAGRLKVILRDFEPSPLPVQIVHGYLERLPHRVRVVIDGLTDRLRNTMPWVRSLSRP